MLDSSSGASIVALNMAEKPFKEFARHYDRFMLEYIDYKGWVDYLEKIFRKLKAEPKTILDLACGTGIPTMLLAGRGYRMTGVDRSREMLEVLENKRWGFPVRTLQADMTDFKLAEPVDAAICLYDSINYLLSEEDVKQCFSCVRQALKQGGLFVFDMNTVYSLSVFWGNRTSPRNVGGICSVWQNSYDEQTRISTLHLTFWEEEEGTGLKPACTPKKFEEVHQERAYSRHEVKQCLKAAGFSRVWFYTHGGFLPVGPLTTRMMVIAR